MIKNKIAILLCRILEKMKVSVIIGMEVRNGMIYSKYSTYIYSNKFVNTEFIDCLDNPVTIPEGKFNYEIKK